MLGRDFHVTSIFCLHCALYQIRTWKLFDNGKKFCSGKNQKRKKVHGKKEKRKKEKKFLCESEWYWRSSTMASRFLTKKSPSNQNLPYEMLNTGFPFLYSSNINNRPAGFFLAFGNFAHYRVFLLNARWVIEMQWITFPGKSWSILIDARRSRCPIGLQFQEER